MYVKIILTGCLMMFLTVGVYAENEKIKHLSIKPVPAISDQKHRLTVEHNIKLIQIVGVVDRLLDDRIIINDSIYRLTEDAVFFSKDQKELSKTDITVGSIVGLRLNDAGKIYKLWKLEEPQQ